MLLHAAVETEGADAQHPLGIASADTGGDQFVDDPVELLV